MSNLDKAINRELAGIIVYAVFYIGMWITCLFVFA